VEESHDIIVSHECRFIGSRFGEIGYHCRRRVTTFAVR
jgi:hypothetical protein